MIDVIIQEWQKVQEDFDKNWTEGTFPGWPVIHFIDLLCTCCAFLNVQCHCVLSQLIECVSTYTEEFSDCSDLMP